MTPYWDQLVTYATLTDLQQKYFGNKQNLLGQCRWFFPRSLPPQLIWLYEKPLITQCKVDDSKGTGG